jgi:hypothetical protein
MLTYVSAVLGKYIPLRWSLAPRNVLLHKAILPQRITAEVTRLHGNYRSPMAIVSGSTAWNARRLGPALQ